MKATLEIECAVTKIPHFIKILKWLQVCPVQELNIYVKSFWLKKNNEKTKTFTTHKKKQ